MVFHSILFESTEDNIKKETLEAPVFFVDLNLDQIIDAITAGKQEYNLKPFFYTSLNDSDTIKYRHEIMRDSEIDYSADVEETFEKFKKGAVKDYRVKFPTGPDMNQVEARILDLVARLYPDIFLNLDDYCAKNGNYVDEKIGVFDREIQFYVAYLEYIAILKRAGLKFCYPQISNPGKEVYDDEGFDLALAYKLIIEKSSVGGLYHVFRHAQPRTG